MALWRRTLSLHESCGFAAALHRKLPEGQHHAACCYINRSQSAAQFGDGPSRAKRRRCTKAAALPQHSIDALIGRVIRIANLCASAVALRAIWVTGASALRLGFGCSLLAFAFGDLFFGDGWLAVGAGFLDVRTLQTGRVVLDNFQ